MGNIKLSENKKVRSRWDEKEEKWYFSVQDVVEILTGSADVKQYINFDIRLNSKNNLCPKCGEYAMRFDTLGEWN